MKKKRTFLAFLLMFLCSTFLFSMAYGMTEEERQYLERFHVQFELGVKAPPLEKRGITATDETKPPYTAKLDWGTFNLSNRVAKKIQDKKELNFIVSIQMLGGILYPKLKEIGMNKGAEKISKMYGVPIKPRLIGPLETNPQKQIAEITALLDAELIDVLILQPPELHGFEDVIEKAMKKGIPVFTDNSDSPASKRIAYVGPQDTPDGNGIKVAEWTIEWCRKNVFKPKAIAYIAGADTPEWSKGRWAAFSKTMKKAFPDAKYYGEVGKAAVVSGWNAADQYAKVRAFAIAHPDVNIYFNTDWSGVQISKVIKDLGMEGESYVVAYNISEEIVGVLGEGPYIASAYQFGSQQTELAFEVVAEFLFQGVIPPEFFWTPIQMISKENKELIKKEGWYIKK